MLKTINLIKDVEEKYIPMLKMVNIPDFTKCIAEFGGLSIDKVDDNTIKEYLLTWAKNKYRFFCLFNNQLRKDYNIEYKKERDGVEEEVTELALSFPTYYYWLREFRYQKENKIKSIDMSYNTLSAIKKLFPQYKLEGSTITHFFKKCINAPDELITKIASIFENDKVNSIYTLSIDPIDMMLASENPYDWTSCYRLETENECSHADGCLAAILDTSSIISYIWNREGQFSLYGTYEFKTIRYKKMRQWISFSDKFTTIHFNEIYPGKSYDDAFEKQLREVVETLVAGHLNIRNMWKKALSANIAREYYYGYSEFSSNHIYVQSDAEEENISVYDQGILCPCGCGKQLSGSDEGIEYLGNGFVHDGFEDRYYCEYAEDYCDNGECCAECCEGCSYWDDNHPICDLDKEECDDPDWDYTHDGVVDSNEEHCSSCPRWKECHQKDEDE